VILLRAALVAAPLVLGLAAIAQPSASPAPAEPPQTAVLPIPLSDIAARAQSVDQVLRRAREQLAPEVRITSIEAALPGVTARLQEESDALEELLPSGPSSEALQEAKRGFRAGGEQLGAWRRLLTSRIENLESPLAEIGQLQHQWKLTQEEARRSGAPGAVLEQVAGVRSGLQGVSEKLKDRRGQLLALQNQIAREELRIEEAIDSLELTERELRRQLFERDAPPLWRAVPEAARRAAPFWEPVRAGLLRDVEQLRDYVRERSDRLLLHAFLFLVLLVGSTAIRRRVRRWEDDDPELRPSHLVLGRPFSSAFLIGILLVPWLHPLAPRILEDLVGLLLLVPVLRLLPRLLDRSLRPAVFGLGAFYLIDQLRGIVAGVPIVERMLLAVEVGAATLLVVWMMRPARLAAVPTDLRLPRWLALAIRTALAILGLALLANLVGFVSLSRLLGQGVLWSAYAALVIYGALRVARAMLRVFVRSSRGRRLNMVRAHAPLLIRRSILLLNWVALLTWVWETLDFFSIREPLISATAESLRASASFGTVELSLGDLVGFIATIAAAVFLSRFLRFVLGEDILPRLRLGRGVPHAISATIHYSVLLLGFFLAVAAAGVDFNRFTLLAGAFGVGIGFGLQNVVNNFASGLILLFERPVQVGDTIEVGSILGEIRRIGIRASTVRTWQGAEVIIPNSSLISEQVTNWTLSDRERRIDIPVGVAYGTDPEQVLEILTGVAREHSEILETPPPMALFRGFGDSSLDFELRAWTHRAIGWVAIQSELAVAINAAFRDAGITIPFPQRDLHLRSVSSDSAKSLSAGGRGASPGDG
jgi:small-conductance mechanosensitive channel